MQMKKNTPDKATDALSSARHTGQGLTQEIEQTAATIMLAEEIIKKQLQKCETKSSEIDESLTVLEQSALKLSRTAENLDELFRFQSGQYQLEKYLVDLAAQYQSALSLCGKITDRAKISFENCLPAGELVLADARIADKILLNLVSNALRTADNIAVKLFLEDQNISVWVKDDGAGIDAALQGHLYEPFETDYIENQLGGGIGLGLYLVKEYCSLLNWKISADSSSAGTTFKLEIPRVQQSGQDLYSRPEDLAFEAEQQGRVALEMSSLKK